MSYDLLEGWDVFNAADRRAFWKELEEDAPLVVTLGPECKVFSQMRRISLDKMDPKTKWEAEMRGVFQLHFAAQVARFQWERGRLFLLEHPAYASSWSTNIMKEMLSWRGVRIILADQCMMGLQVHPDGPSRKRTGFIGNCDIILDCLKVFQCNCKHHHITLERGKLCRKAQVYPPGLCRAVARGLLETVSFLVEQ